MQSVGHHHSFDHVGHHGHERTTLHAHGDGDVFTAAADGPIDTHDARWTPEPGGVQAASPRLVTQHARHLGEIEGAGPGASDVLGHGEMTLARGCDTACDQRLFDEPLPLANSPTVQHPGRNLGP